MFASKTGTRSVIACNKLPSSRQLLCVMTDKLAILRLLSVCHHFASEWVHVTCNLFVIARRLTVIKTVAKITNLLLSVSNLSTCAEINIKEKFTRTTYSPAKAFLNRNSSANSDAVVQDEVVNIHKIMLISSDSTEMLG